MSGAAATDRVGFSKCASVLVVIDEQPAHVESLGVEA